jgi:hypothetical protein
VLRRDGRRSRAPAGTPAGRRVLPGPSRAHRSATACSR